MLTDNSIINFGIHKGKEIQDVPPQWLFWFHNIVEEKIKKQTGTTTIEQEIHEYVVDNMQVLRKELNESKQKK